ncbi:hypothetical protein DFAR_3930005 [Desulfarculales bacterium]
MSEAVSVTILGAGVVAWRLAQAGLQVLILERNPGVSQGENQSSRNSGAIHAGFTPACTTIPRPALRRPAWARAVTCCATHFCTCYDVPALRCGKLVMASQKDQRPVLD